MSRTRLDQVDKVEIASTDDLRAWLIQNHTRPDSIWLVTYKKIRPEKYVSYDQIVDDAICFGWIDSLPRKLDDERTMLLLSPRKPGSAWSAVNKDRVRRMQAAGRMHAAGVGAVAAAQQDGSWDFLNDVDALIEPGDLARALDTIPNARANWDAFSRSSRRGILEWIKQAKQPATRARRIADTANKAVQGIKANH